ncbi:hypothetical protein PoB_002313800 [Plakobranchus ocellatus]|uniref:Uncharacterized protein n=1 Tax=Plakobranchus ocellatus TaxID=259542 RepID=A0AAV3ZP72_9GAST|nr:hypothetical protein PoB_002313800 [Plakobranchus ocellatus]
MILDFQALRQARPPSSGVTFPTERALQISGPLPIYRATDAMQNAINWRSVYGESWCDACREWEVGHLICRKVEARRLRSGEE